MGMLGALVLAAATQVFAAQLTGQVITLSDGDAITVLDTAKIQH